MRGDLQELPQSIMSDHSVPLALGRGEVHPDNERDRTEPGPSLLSNSTISQDKAAGNEAVERSRLESLSKLRKKLEVTSNGVRPVYTGRVYLEQQGRLDETVRGG